AMACRRSRRVLGDGRVGRPGPPAFSAVRAGPDPFCLVEARADLALRANERLCDSRQASASARSRSVSTETPMKRLPSEPAELADGLALSRYAALGRRFAPCDQVIALGPPLTGPLGVRRLGSLCEAAKYHVGRAERWPR